MSETGVVAKTIVSQLGGGRFAFMTGAKNFVDLGDGVAFSIPTTKNGKRINKVSIKLKADDTYTVTFARIYKLDLKTVSEHEGIYADMLRELFTRVTGLHTHL